MRIVNRIITTIFLVACVYAHADSWGIKRYSDTEVDTLYQNSYSKFVNSEFKQAREILLNIEPHQNIDTSKHIEVFNIFNSWNSSSVVKNLSKLNQWGVDKKQLDTELCTYALDNFKIDLFEYCARNNSTFTSKLDSRIGKLLRRVYTEKDEPFFKHKILASLINASELTQNLGKDSSLVQERILIKLNESNCLKSYCRGANREAIIGTVRGFIYGRS